MAELPVAFGRYRVSRSLGEGAMGSVYVARDEVLGRDVAIKTIRPAAMPIGGAARFINEGRAAAQLSHPNIVRVFDVGDQAGVPYLVMELVAGGSLKDRIVRGLMQADEVRKLGIQISHALQAAHERGIVHRDVKPANILEAADGVWKLADFGIAHVPDSTLTLDGQFLGSPAYAAPESLRAGVFVAASDIYALAVTLFEAATGRLLHEGGIEARFKTADVGVEVQRSRLLDVDAPGLVDAIAFGLAPSPSDRPTAVAMAVMIAEAIAAPTSMPAIPRSFATPPGGIAMATPPVGVSTVALADSVAVPPARGVDTVALADSIAVPPTRGIDTVAVSDSIAIPHTPLVVGSIVGAAHRTELVADSRVGAAPAMPPPVQPHTQFVADSVVAPREQVMQAPKANAKKRAVPIAIGIGVAGLVVIAIIASRRQVAPATGSGSGSAVAESPGSGSPVVAPDAQAPVVDSEVPVEPPLQPGELRIVTPRAAIERRDAAKEWSRIVDRLYDDRLEDALEKLDDWERKFGATDETRSLRAQITALEQGRENDDRHDEHGD
jgi:serine/threonine-protein kinase